MGNVCGCVRAEKEEYYVDPAKIPLSPEKYSPGRKYFRRSPIKKTLCDTASGKPNSQNEDKKSHIQLSEEEPALLSRGLVQEDSVTPDPSTVQGGVQQERTEAVTDGVKQKLLSSAASSRSSSANLSPVKDAETEVKVSELNQGISEKDGTPYCTKRKNHLDNVNTREITFRSKTDAFPFQKAASLSSIHYGTERSFEKSQLAKDPSKSDSCVLERQNSERFCPQAKDNFQLEKKRCHSVCTKKSSFSQNTDGSKVSERRFLGTRCKSVLQGCISNRFLKFVCNIFLC